MDDETVPAAPRSTRLLKVATLAVSVLALLSIGAFAYVANVSPESRFCRTGLGFVEIDGKNVIPQDQGDPGRGACDIADRLTPGQARAEAGTISLVLGFDCKVRDPDGRVVATQEPNRADGTCGQGR